MYSLHRNTDDVLAIKTVNTMEAISGKHPKAKRAHAKGIRGKATFTPSPDASKWSRSTFFKPGSYEAEIRFSTSSPNPQASDLFAGIKGLAVKLGQDQKESHTLVCANAPVFVTSSAETFSKMMDSVEKLKEGKFTLSGIGKLAKEFPEAKNALQAVKGLKPSTLYEATTYYSIHVFYLLNEEGKRIPVKFEWNPTSELVETEAKEEEMGEDVLFQKLEQSVQHGKVSFELVAVIGTEEDSTIDPTVLWPETRERVVLGSLKVTSLEEDDQLLFDPNDLPSGVEASKDEILEFRTKVYRHSMEKRTAE
ncbi:catalase [Paenisporosarcina cavernae]|uniref:Catalase-related peroxidase n=1 Tax=Paenisporosarcina cavernae TaxID=2320858 RepID=A0A385YPH0_9BACL|nr:catalase [Paenisporosarcina cavernae]AYC28605.1 catalase [Paenisporosarcina cavernae]